METLFERLESLCEGAIAIDRTGRVVYVNEKYLPALGLALASEALGRPIEEIIPNSLMRRWPARFTFDDYSLTDRFYSGVSRYTTSGFLRIKLGEATAFQRLAPHIFESA